MKFLDSSYSLECFSMMYNFECGRNIIFDTEYLKKSLHQMGMDATVKNIFMDRINNEYTR